MNWPADDIATTDLDAQTDTPPRAMFLRIAQRLKSIIGARGQANGVCDLDAMGHIPAARLGGSNVAGAPVRLDAGRRVPVAQLPGATESAAGVVELASAAEAAGLSVTNRAVSPGRLPRASTAQRGVVEMATLAEVQAGINASKAVSPKTFHDAVLFTRTVQSYNMAFQRDRDYTFSLSPLAGQSPELVSWRLRCVRAEHGYAVGDRLWTAPGLVHENRSGTDSIYGFMFTVAADRNTAHLRIAKNGIRALPKTTGNSQGVILTDANWRIEIQLWA